MDMEHRRNDKWQEETLAFQEMPASFLDTLIHSFNVFYA